MSTTTKHTPEPWATMYCDGDKYVTVSDDNLGTIACFPIRNAPSYPHNENAARAVACVNACAGIEDPAAELERLRAVEVLAKTVADMNWFKTTGLNFAAISALRTALGAK